MILWFFHFFFLIREMKSFAADNLIERLKSKREEKKTFDVTVLNHKIPFFPFLPFSPYSLLTLFSLTLSFFLPFSPSSSHSLQSLRPLFSLRSLSFFHTVQYSSAAIMHRPSQSWVKYIILQFINHLRWYTWTLSPSRNPNPLIVDLAMRLGKYPPLSVGAQKYKYGG